MKKVEDPSHPLKYPHVASHKMDDFERLLEYFGLVDYFNLSSPSTMTIFSKSNFVQYEGKNYVAVIENDNNAVSVVKLGGTNIDYGVACTTELDPAGEGCFWKVTIDDSSPIRGLLFLGILGNLNLKQHIYLDATAFGWGAGNQGFIKGYPLTNLGGWTRFNPGECLYFHFKSDKLSMHSVQKKKTFFIDGIDTVTTKYYFHTNITDVGTSMILGPLNAEERKTFTDNE